MRHLLTLLILSTLSYTVVPSSAQERSAADRERELEEVRTTERMGVEAARRWAAERRLPQRIRQANGSIIELTAVYDGRPVYLIPANARAAALLGTSAVHPGGRTGLGATGLGFRIGLWDSGHALSSHAELSGRVDFGDEAEISAHATHVAGTLAASGLEPAARGMAYQARLTSYTWTNDATEMSNEATSGLLISNHSYGVLAGWHYGDLESNGDQWYWLGDPGVSDEEDFIFGRYDVEAVQFDRIAHLHPEYLPVVAAGNDRQDTGPTSGTYRAFDAQGDYRTYSVQNRSIPRDGGLSGFDTIAGAAVAKNVLTVGSMGPVGTTGSPRTSPFSSFGPTDDGRIKPDLAGVGESVFSLSASSGSGYGLSSGTSMATATVTGSLALLQQYHRDLFGSPMTAATLKALAIHTATDQGAAGPDYRTGWGFLNTEAAALHIQAAIEHDGALVETYLLEGESFIQEVLVSEPGDVRVTLGWSDPPSVRTPRSGPSSLDDAMRHLRNDLDVRLVHTSTGTVHEPYVLDPSNPDGGAFRGDNDLDPVEQIYLAQADTGRYAIVVTHEGAFADAPRQDFSLLVSGAAGPPSPVSVAHLTAEATLDGVKLTWRTLYERQAGSFFVERRDASVGKTDGFTRVGSLDVGGVAGREYEFADPVSVAGVYQYRIVYDNGNSTYVAGTIQVNLAAPESYALLSSYPNPFSTQTTLVIDLPRTQRVELDVFDVMGRRVASPFQGELAAGRHHIDVHGDSWARGVYFVRVLTPGGSTAHRMIKR